jgi:hypothetical protein
MATPGQSFTITGSFGSSGGPTYSGSTTVTPPVTGNNPQDIDQLVNTTLATATAGVNAGDQRIAGPGGKVAWFPTKDIGYAASPTNSANGGGYGFKATLVTAGGLGGAQNVVVKFINTANSTVTSYTLVNGQQVSMDSVGASGALGNTNITEIDCTPSPDGSTFEVQGILNLNV